MKFCLYCCHSKTLAPLAEITEGNKRSYAREHGYDFRGEIIPEGKSYVDIGFERIQRVLDTVQFSMKWGGCSGVNPVYDWVYFTGSDSMITNFRITLKDITTKSPTGTDLIVGMDSNGWNADSFLVRCNNRVAAYLSEVVRQKARFLRPHYEQDAMFANKDMVAYHEPPQRTMNSYDYWNYRGFGGKYLEGVDFNGNDGNWQSDDFLIHWPACSLEHRMKLAQEIQPKIIHADTPTTRGEAVKR